MVEDEQAFLVVEDRVVMGQALVVANVTEGFEHRNAGLQDALGHQRFKVTRVAQALHILAEDAVQSFVAVDFNAALFAQCAHVSMRARCRMASCCFTKITRAIRSFRLFAPHSAACGAKYLLVPHILAIVA